MPESNESFMNGELGLGMAIPEEATAKLGPLPSLFPSGRTERDSEEPDTESYDAFLEQLAEDTKQYVKAVFKTLVATVPKAIIHAQVKQSQEHLLERLYAYVTGLKPGELDMLLDEDSEVTQKRAAAQMSIKDITSSIVELKRVEEKRIRTQEDERPPKEEVSRAAIEQSGMWDLLPGGGPAAQGSSPYGQYTPRSLQGRTPFTETRRSPAPNGTAPSARSAPTPGSRPTSAGAAPGAPSPLTQKPRRRPPPAPPGQ
jgi:hypothetical protein